MLTFLYVLHFIVCFILIGVVLLQRGKGQDLGASLGGGGANTIFGSRGAGNFLTKMTTASAIIFMGTSLSLSYLGYKSSDVRLFDESKPFVPEGMSPKTEESGLEEVPGAAADAGAANGAGAAGATAGEATGAAADAEPGLVEIPSETDAAAPAAAGEAAGAPSSATPAAAAPAAAPSAAPAASPEAGKAPAPAAAPSDPSDPSAASAPAPAADGKQP